MTLPRGRAGFARSVVMLRRNIIVICFAEGHRIAIIAPGLVVLSCLICGKIGCCEVRVARGERSRIGRRCLLGGMLRAADVRFSYRLRQKAASFFRRR